MGQMNQMGQMNKSNMTGGSLDENNQDFNNYIKYKAKYLKLKQNL